MVPAATKDSYGNHLLALQEQVDSGKPTPSKDKFTTLAVQLF
jgi:hypothetical protein